MKFAHYQVLLTIHTARLMGDLRGLSPSQIRVRLAPETVFGNGELGRVLSQLTDPAYHPDGPLLRFERQRYVICGNEAQPGVDLREYEPETGGFKVLAEARSNPRLREHEKEWVERVRWPSTAADGAHNTVAVPTGSSRSGYTGDPERALGRTTTRARFAELHREGFRWCASCNDGRGGWQQREEFTRGNRTCKRCRRVAARRRRRHERNRMDEDAAE